MKKPLLHCQLKFLTSRKEGAGVAVSIEVQQRGAAVHGQAAHLLSWDNFLFVGFYFLLSRHNFLFVGLNFCCAARASRWPDRTSSCADATSPRCPETTSAWCRPAAHMKRWVTLSGKPFAAYYSFVQNVSSAGMFLIENTCRKQTTARPEGVSLMMSPIDSALVASFGSSFSPSASMFHKWASQLFNPRFSQRASKCLVVVWRGCQSRFQ